VEFSERLFRLARPGIRNQAQRVRVHPSLILAASQPSARDLASSPAVATRYPELRTLAHGRSKTESLARVLTGLRRGCRTGCKKNEKEHEKSCDRVHFSRSARMDVLLCAIRGLTTV
jgi:hypothetical protein